LDENERGAEVEEDNASFLLFQSKCEEYFPRSDGVDNTLMFGDFMVVLKLQDVRQDYILSGLTLKDVEVSTSIPKGKVIFSNPFLSEDRLWDE
jgi:hypothetical protein